MWTEGFALIGGFTAYCAVMTVFHHVKGLITGYPDFDIDRRWKAASYAIIVVILFFGLQSRPIPCRPSADQVCAERDDPLDGEAPEFFR